MSCTVLIGTRDHFTPCGLGWSDTETCVHHRAFLFELPRTRDQLVTLAEAHQGVRHNAGSPGPSCDLPGLGANQPKNAHRASAKKGAG